MSKWKYYVEQSAVPLQSAVPFFTKGKGAVPLQSGVPLQRAKGAFLYKVTKGKWGVPLAVPLAVPLQRAQRAIAYSYPRTLTF